MDKQRTPWWLRELTPSSVVWLPILLLPLLGILVALLLPLFGWLRR